MIIPEALIIEIEYIYYNTVLHSILPILHTTFSCIHISILYFLFIFFLSFTFYIYSNILLMHNALKYICKLF